MFWIEERFIVNPFIQKLTLVRCWLEYITYSLYSLSVSRPITQKPYILRDVHTSIIVVKLWESWHFATFLLDPGDLPQVWEQYIVYSHCTAAPSIIIWKSVGKRTCFVMAHAGEAPWDGCENCGPLVIFGHVKEQSSTFCLWNRQGRTLPALNSTFINAPEGI